MSDTAKIISCCVVVIIISNCCSLNSGERKGRQDLYGGQFTTTTEPTKSSIINLTLDESKNNRKGRRQKLIVSTVLEEPYMMFRGSGLFLTENDRFEGFVADILRRIHASTGIEYEIRLASDGKYGDLQTDGTWDGSIGEVIRGVVDVAAGPLTVTDQRRRFVDFTDSFLSLRSSALLKRPPPRPDRPKDHLDHPLTNGEQLLTTDHVYGVLRDSPVQGFLSTSNDPMHRAMWTRMTGFWPTAMVDSLQEGLERVRRERFAFIIESPTAEYLASRKPCDLYATEPFLESLSYAFAVRRGDAELKAKIDGELRKMADNSELQLMYLRWWKDECIRYSHSPSASAAKHEPSISRRSNSTAALVAWRSVSNRCHGNRASHSILTMSITTILLATTFRQIPFPSMILY